MKVRTSIVWGIALLCAGIAHAQVPPTPAPDQMALLNSSDPKLAANKKLVFDMWRYVVQAGRTDMAKQYIREDYIQHNPNVETGLQAFLDYIKKTRPVRPVESKILFPVIALMAEGDLVMMATVSVQDDPTKPGEQYASTHFDMFRIQDGKIAEHWDSVEKRADAFTYDPNTQYLDKK